MLSETQANNEKLSQLSESYFHNLKSSTICHTAIHCQVFKVKKNGVMSEMFT